MCQNFCFQFTEEARVFFDLSVRLSPLISCLRSFLPIAKRTRRFLVILANGSEVSVTNTTPPYIELALRETDYD